MFHHTDLSQINARRRELEAQAAQHRLARSAQAPRATPAALIRTFGTHAKLRTTLRHHAAARNGSISARSCDQHRAIDVEGGRPQVADGTV